MNADSVVTDSIAAQTINTNDFETTNAEIDKLYVDTIKATGFLELPTAGQQYYTITVPAKTTASFSGIYTSDNNTDYPFYFTVSDGAVIYKQGSTEIIKDISFDRETGYTKVRVKSSTNITYISSALDSNPVTIEDGGDAYADYAFIPQKTGGYLIRGYDDTTTEVYIAGVLRAYAMSVEEEIIERTSVDFLKVNASIELPQDWDAGGTISYSTGEENQYISAQTKAGVTKPTWTSPIHSTIGSLSYSSKLVDEATIASYKGISETRQTQTISITGEASLQQLTAFHWTKNGNYWQPYELTRITIGDQTMWIDPTEANQGIRFYNNQVIADGTWDDVPVEEANAVPVNLVIFDAPTELSFPITNLGDKTTVHGEITATCFKGNVLGNVTGNADTATDATCFDNKTYAEAKADILSGCAADSNKFNNKTYSEAKSDILSGNAASATNATCFDNKTYSEAKADILSGCAANANDATCFNGKTYAEAKTDILTGTAAQAHCVDIDSLTTNSYPLVMESTTCELGKSGTCSITFTPSTGTLETNQVSTSCIENSGTTKSQCLCATCDLNVDGDAFITGDLTVQGTITTTHSEEVVTPSENIILRDGATTPIASGSYSGFTVTNYDGQDNNLEVGADKDGTLHVGVVGGTMEPIATRATEACMENGYAAHWDATGTDLVTKGATNTHDLTVNGDASVTGTLTADLTGTADNATCFDGKTYSEAKADILSGNAASATNATCFNGKTYACAKADILTGCAADSAKLGNKAASCYIDNSSTAQTKAGNLSIGAPAACTSTSAGGNGLLMCSLGTIELYKEGTPYIDFHYDKYCGDYSSRICSGSDGSLDITINNGKGCTTATQTNTYCFKSNGTFTGACTICASTNIYSAGCPVVTTGTLPTVAPGYNCTGTSNYVVTTMVCCAKSVCRYQATTGTCHLALFAGNTDAPNANMNVSNACPLTFAPATGVLSTKHICACTDSYHALLPSPNGTTKYITLKLRNADGRTDFTSNVDIYVFSNHVNFSIKVSDRVVSLNKISRTADYGIDQYLLGEYDGTNKTVTIYLKITKWREASIVSSSPIVEASISSTAPTGTFVDIPFADRTNYVGLADANAEYPLVFSTCCATPASSFKTLYNDTANNLMYNPSTNTLTACRVRGAISIRAGFPLACTSTQVGSCGTEIDRGSLELYHSTPFIDFHQNNACADYSHRLIANNSYLRVTATNATGCCAATQTANFDFCSNGTLKATCFCGALCGSAQKVCRNAITSNASCHLALLAGNNDADDTCIYVSSACPITYNPATGVLTATCLDGTINMNCVADAASTNVAAGNITRKTIVRNQITNVGYVTSVAVGLCRGSSGFGQAIISVSCNDAATAWKDYCFDNTGTISANGLRLRNDGRVTTGVYMKVGTASSNANRNIMFTPAVPGCDDTSTAEVQVSSGCPLTYNPSTGVLTACTFCGNATRFGGCTYSQAKTDILNGVTKNTQFVLSGCTLTITM